MAETEPKHAEGLEGLDADQVEELQKVVSETDAPHDDPVTGQSDGSTDGGYDARARKDAERNKKDLLFESADTWQHMEVPE